MKVGWLGCLVVASLAWAASAQAPRRAPDFALVDVNPRSSTHGRKLALRDLYAERGLVLQFSASWCEHCRAELPGLQDLFARAHIPLALVAADENGYPESMGLVAERAALDAPILFVPQRRVARIGRQFTHEVLPATYLIDKNGRIVRQFVGAKPIQELAEAIRAELLLGP